METVTLKSLVGPVTARYRPLDENGVPTLVVYDWNFDNDFRVAVSSQWWEKVRDEYLDRTTEKRWRHAFQPL